MRFRSLTVAQSQDINHQSTRFSASTDRWRGWPPAGPKPAGALAYLFGPESDVNAASFLDSSCHVAGFKRAAALVQRRDQQSFDDTIASSRDGCRGGRAVEWDSHLESRALASNWESHLADPKCERDVVLQLEELADDAPLWLLLTRVCPHTRDGGALMHAVVVEELAEWSARLAAEQTAAATQQGQQQEDDDQEEEEWGARADRRADYWHEVAEALQELNRKDVSKAGGRHVADICDWLTQQSRELQAEHSQLQALTDELGEAHSQVLQSTKWRESQFEMQNRVLQTEVASLKQSIAERSTKFNSKVSDKKSAGAAKRLSMSHDSLDASK